MSGAHKRIQFPTRKAAELHLATTAVKVNRGEYVAPAKIPTFGAVAQEWMRGKEGRHPATLSSWRVHLAHLAPLDALRLDRIDVAEIEKLRDALGAKGLGHKTVGTVMTTAGAVFKMAIRRGYTTANPAQLAERPRRPVREVKDGGEAETGALRADEVLNAAEIARLLEHATPGLWKTYLATAASTGMRSEELGAIAWSDIELDAGRLFIRRSLSWAPDAGRAKLGRGKDVSQEPIKPRFYPTKTKSGERTLQLPAELVAMLRVWKMQCPPSAHDLVFCGPDGTPLRRSTILRSGIYQACRRAGLRQCGVKVLRHSFASGLLAMGAPITQVQHLLGHSNPGVTLRVYSHWISSADSGIPARFASSFLGALPVRVKPAA
jgi:integrase